MIAILLLSVQAPVSIDSLKGPGESSPNSVLLSVPSDQTPESSDEKTRIVLKTIHFVPTINSPFHEETTPVSPADLVLIKDVIESQLKAISEDDFERAFSFASPEFQKQCGDANTFKTMVLSSYRQIISPRAVMFEVPRQVIGYVAQPVVMLALNGDMLVASYLMKRLATGEWKINGCVLTPLQ